MISLSEVVAIRRILVPLDGSEHSRRALPWVDLLAQGRGAAIELLRVIPTPASLAAQTAPGIQPAAASAPLVDVTTLLATLHRTAREELERDSARLSHPSVAYVVEGVPAKAIVEYAESTSIDLIVMTTRGEGGLKRLVLGSTTDEVIRSSSRPVFVVPAHD